MMIDIFKHEDNWQEVKDAAMNTCGKDSGKYPDSEWKRRLLLAEHSPIRLIRFYWRWKDLKSWVSVHIVRHKFGIEHWVKSQRSDRTGVVRDKLPQDSPVDHACEANAQALINMSRKRLCSCASPKTREAWQEVKAKVAEVEPELASCMVKECIYRGFCPELKSCGYEKTEAFYKELQEYRGRQVFSRVEKKEEPFRKNCRNCAGYDHDFGWCTARDVPLNHLHDDIRCPYWSLKEE